MTTDEITLTIPREPGFDGVAHLVLSGLAVRLNLTIENLEDLQIALDSLFDAAEQGGELTVGVRVKTGELVARVGPISPRVLDELERESGGELGRRGVLASTVDDVSVDGEWVELTKKVTAVHG
jgi:antitoxin (DNA-binding transcriptional repressor) of toxin-antitoxin stability system